MIASSSLSEPDVAPRESLLWIVSDCSPAVDKRANGGALSRIPHTNCQGLALAGVLSLAYRSIG
jgi:hypothetical protein